MANVIGLIQRQSQSGRSTIATQLAAFLAQKKSVVLIDADPEQKTSSMWGNQYLKTHPTSFLLLERAFNYQEIIAVVEDVMFEHDYIVVDASVHVDITRAVLTMSDLCVVPCHRETIVSLTYLQAAIDEANLLKPNLDIRGLWQGEKSALPSPWIAFEQVFSKRTVYQDVLQNGQTVFDRDDEDAKEEVQNFGEEVCSILETKPKRAGYFRVSRN